MIIARKKYADRYENEEFWRIPGGMVGVWIVVIVGSIGTIGGIYYSFVTPWIDVPQADVDDVGRFDQPRHVRARRSIVYVFGRRSAHKTEPGGLAGTPGGLRPHED